MALELAVAIVIIALVGGLIHFIGQGIKAPENAWLQLLFVFLALLSSIIAIFGTSALVADYTTPQNVTTNSTTTQTWSNVTTNATQYNATGAYLGFTIAQTPVLASTVTTLTQVTPTSSSAVKLTSLLNVLGLVLLAGLFITLGFFIVRLTEFAIEYFKAQGEKASKTRFR